MDREPKVRGKMIVDATIPWRYRERKKAGGIGYFSLSGWPEGALLDYAAPDDLARWTVRRAATGQPKSVVK